MMKKNGKSWIHPDSAIQEGIIYNVKVNLKSFTFFSCDLFFMAFFKCNFFRSNLKYVGSIGVNESMKSLSFETRTLVAR